VICNAIARSGERCRAIAIGGSDYCHAHHPDRAEARRRAARKGGRRGGRGRVNGDTAELRGLLSTLYEDVLEGSVQPNVAAVGTQILNARIRLVETERRLRELEDVNARIEALEALEAARESEGRSRGW